MSLKIQELPKPTHLEEPHRSYLNQLLRVLEINLENLQRAADTSFYVGIPNTVVDSLTYQLSLSDVFLICDSSSNTVTIELPPVANYSNRRITVKRSSNSVNDVILEADGSDLIDGASTFVLAGTTYDSINLYSDGFNWWTF